MANVVEYVLNLQNNLSGGIQDATTHTKQLEAAIGGVKSTAMSMLSTLGVSFAIFKGAEYVHDAVESVERLHQAVAQVEQGLKSTKNAAGMTFEDVEASAKSLSSQMKYSRADLLEMQSVLITFPSVTKETFGEASEVIANMSTALGQDLKSSAIQVGKALQDPEHGITALRRVGVNFNETQTEMVKKMVATGQQAKAQAFILNELQTEFGGRAKAAFDADPLAKFNKIMGSIKVKIGELGIGLLKGLTPDLEGMATAMKETISIAEDVKNWVTSHIGLFVALKDGLIAAGVAFGVFKVIEIGQIAITKSLILWEGIQLASINKLGDGYLTASKSMIAFSGVMETVELAIEANPIGAVILAIGALTAGFMALTNNITAATEANDKFKKSILGLVQDAKAEGAKEVYEIADRFEQGIKGFDKTGKAIKYTIDEKNRLIKEAIGEQIKLVEEAHTVVKNGIPILDLGFAGQQQIMQLQNYKSLIANRGKDKTANNANAAVAPSLKTKAEGQKNVNIHIAINGGLIHGDFKIVTNKISEGMGKVKDMVAEALTGAINDSQIVASN